MTQTHHRPGPAPTPTTDTTRRVPVTDQVRQHLARTERSGPFTAHDFADLNAHPGSVHQALLHLARDGALTTRARGVYWKADTDHPPVDSREADLDDQLRAHIRTLPSGATFSPGAFSHLDSADRVHRSLTSLTRRGELRHLHADLFTPAVRRVTVTEQIRRRLADTARQGPFTARDFMALGAHASHLGKALRDLAQDGTLTAVDRGVYWKAGAGHVRTRLTETEFNDQLRAHIHTLPPGTMFGPGAFRHMENPDRVARGLTYLKNQGELRRFSRGKYTWQHPEH